MSFRLNSLYAIEYYRNVFVSDEQVRRGRSAIIFVFTIGISFLKIILLVCMCLCVLSYTNNTEKSVFMSKKIKKSSKRIQNVVFSLKRQGKQEKKEYGIAD